QARFGRRSSAWHAAAFLPALWVLFEWWRGWFLSGFPWLNLGYSQIDTPLGAYAPLVGVYGVSLFTAISAGLLVACVRARRQLPVWLSLLAVIWVSGGLLESVEWGGPDGAVLHAALAAGDVAWRGSRQ